MSVAFGAPIGGVLFSLEEVSRNTSSRIMLRKLEMCHLARMWNNKTEKIVLPHPCKANPPHSRVVYLHLKCNLHAEISININ